MKYCTKCGNKIKDDSKFCTRCGNPTRLGIEQIKEENEVKKEEENQKLLLKIGVSLIIISSIIFAFVVWKDISNILKVCFLSAEILVFFSISLVSKKVGSNNSYKSFWFIGAILIPMVLILIVYYKLLVIDYFLKGAGLYVYLSICSFICIIVYLKSYKYTDSKLYLYLNCFLLNMFILFIMLSFNLDKYFNNNADLVFTISILFNLLLSVLSLVKKNSKYSNIFINYMKFTIIIYLPLIISYTTYDASNLVTLIFSNIMYLAICYIVVIYNKKSLYNNFIPVILTIISIIFINTIFMNYSNMSIYFISLVLILSLFISYFIDITSFKIITFIINILAFIYILSYSISYNYIVTLVISILLITVSIFILKVDENNGIKDTISIILPILLYFLITSLISSIMIINSIYIIIISSLVYSIIYSFLLVRKNKSSSIYEWFSYIFLMMAILGSIMDSNKIACILTEVLCIYYLIFKSFFDRQIYIRNCLFLLSILNLILVCAILGMRFYYVLLIMSFILITINYKNKDNNILYIFGTILLIFASLFNFSSYNIFGLLFNLILYMFVYFITFRNKNINFIFKFLYVILGLFIITKIITNVIDQIFISSLISFIISIIILIIMFLAEEDSDRRILSYTIYLIYPYSIIINNISILSEYIPLMILSLLTIYMFVFLEKVFNIKKGDRIVLELLWLIFIFLRFISVTNTVNTIYLFIISILCILFGIKVKKTAFLNYGIITLVINLFIQLIRLNSSLAIAVIFLIFGTILVQYVLIKEIKRGKK